MTNNNLDEKRGEGRLLSRLSSSVKIVSTDSADRNEGDLVECITRDISFTGVCLLIKENLPVNSKVILKIKNPISGSEYNHMCETTWSREKEGAYLVGLHIHEHLCDVSEWKNMVICLLSD